MHDHSESDLGTILDTRYVNVTGDTMTGSLFIGTNTPSADDTMVNIVRNLSGVANSHAVRDESTLTMTLASTGYSSFDSQYSITSNQSFDHFACFQSRPLFNGSGTITKYNGFWSLPSHTGAGTITWGHHFNVSDFTGAGTITNQAALYVENLTRATNNYAIYSAGADTQSYHGGYFRINNSAKVDKELLVGTLGVGLSSPTTEIFRVNCGTDGTYPQAASFLMTTSATTSGQVLQFVGALTNNGASSGVNTFYGINGSLSLNATAANAYYRYIYGIFGRVSWTANSPYTTSSIGGYAIHAESPGATGAGTFSIAEVVGVNVANQGNSKWATAYGIRVAAQSGSTNSYAIFTNAGLNEFNDQLFLDGSADRIQLRVQSHSAQTTNLATFEDSSSVVQALITGLGGFTFNENGADADGRIEGDTATQLLVTDAGLDAVLIGTTTAGVIADFRTSGVVFNEDGTGTRDFRIESDTESNMLFLDADGDTDGALYLGGSTNGIKINKGGEFTMLGTATVFDDLNFDPTSSGGPTVTIPDYVEINNVIHREFTSANNQLCGGGEELPHSYKLSSTLYPHLHLFLKNGESAGTTGVTFTFYWELRQSTGTTSGSVTLSATSAQLATTAGANVYTVYDNTGFAGSAELGGQLMVKIARTAGDAGDIVVTTYGVHYEKDTVGSKTVASK